jgi:transposase
MKFRNINELRNRNEAEKSLINWIYKTNDINIKEFNTVGNTLKSNIQNILNFFINSNTNAEPFNSKLKLFRANLRGVVDTKFFLFRIE